MGSRSVIVLDTHIWIWWVSEPDKLSRKALSAINYAQDIAVSPISCWEIATKEAKGRLALDRPIDVWVRQALARPSIRLVALSAEIAIRAGQLGEQGFHGDPADRIIVASAITHGAELVTKDRDIRAFSSVRTIW